MSAVRAIALTASMSAVHDFAIVALKAFTDTDTLYIEFRARPVAETKDLDENTVLDVDPDGNICAITVESGPCPSGWTRMCSTGSAGTFIFEDEAFGEFRFIAVRGWMDCRFSELDRKPLVEFSWQGKDGRDDASGRGWAVIDENDTLAGRIYVHQGDDSAFTATRTNGGRPTVRRPRRRPRKL